MPSRTKCRADEIVYDEYFEDGDRLVRVLSREGERVFYEDATDTEDDPPREMNVATFCRTMRAVRRTSP